MGLIKVIALLCQVPASCVTLPATDDGFILVVRGQQNTGQRGPAAIHLVQEEQIVRSDCYPTGGIPANASDLRPENLRPRKIICGDQTVYPPAITTSNEDNNDE